MASATLLAALLLLPAAASAQTPTDRQENMRMPGVSIEGERQTPDIFFVFPTGKGGNLSAPKFRDYGPDILDPVVKPWFERDQMVLHAGLQAASTTSFDWDEALKSSPAAGPPPAPPPVAAPAAPPPLPPPAMAAPSLPPPSIPSQALSLPRTAMPPASAMPPAPAMPPASANPPPSASQPLYPPGSRPWVPPPPPEQPAGGDESVPILRP